MVAEVGLIVGFADVDVKPEGFETHEYEFPAIELTPIVLLCP